MIDHTTKRILLFGGTCVSFSVCVMKIAPRVIAWNTASQGALIASTRAATCRTLDRPISRNTIPVDGKTGRTLPPGTFLCDWEGMTGQINGTGAIDYLKQGQSEEIAKTLKSRGFVLK